MRRSFLFLLSALLCSLILSFALGSCAGPGSASSGQSSALTPQSGGEYSGSGEESQSSESIEVSTPEVNRDWPVVSGTFMQPGSFLSFSVSNWKNHFKNLKEVGIDIFIIQWTADTPEGVFKSVYYPSELTEDNKTSSFYNGSTLLPRVLEAAEEEGIKVFVGLNLSDEWWQFACTRDAWNKKQSDLGVAMAEEIYGLYKDQYPNALYGWYFAWELYNGMRGYEKKVAEFLNMYLDPLTLLDPSMFMFFSPFVTHSGGTPKEAESEWKKVFADANFRQGDIFCCQDAVGAGHIDIEELTGYFASLKSAVDTKPGLIFWANSENFTIDYKSAYLGRFIRQMEIASDYVSGYVTFAYSHYYAKDFNGKGGFHRAYKHYYDTGEKNVPIPSPSITYNYENDRAEFKIVCQNTPAGIEKIIASTPGRSDYVKTIPIAQLNNDSFTFHYFIYPEEGETGLSLEVTAYDYYGNSSSATIDIIFE